jgi:DNA modification methylase
MNDETVDSLVTDPPAGISFMNKSWDGDKGGRNQWISWMSELMKECLHHPTVKPQKLMQYLIRMITPPNGTVLDPFMGSGSTCIAAKSLGFNFIGIEKEKEYFEIAEKRLAF